MLLTKKGPMPGMAKICSVMKLPVTAAANKGPSNVATGIKEFF
jgi:hypothetical protein